DARGGGGWSLVDTQLGRHPDLASQRRPHAFAVLLEQHIHHGDSACRSPGQGRDLEPSTKRVAPAAVAVDVNAWRPSGHEWRSFGIGELAGAKLAHCLEREIPDTTNPPVLTRSCEYRGCCHRRRNPTP